MRSTRFEPESLLIIAAICLTIAGMVTCSVFLFKTRLLPYRVEGAIWVATTRIEQKTLAHGDGWRRPTEPSAHNVRCERRVYDTYDCFCVDIGSDEFPQKICSTCTDYEDWCEYDYFTWPTIRKKAESGKPEEEPRWPEIQFTPPDQRERKGIELIVNFSNEEKETHQYHPRNITELRAYHPGDYWEIAVNRAGKFEPQKELLGENE